MYIKQLVIEGFKTYSEHTSVEALDSGVNVVIGCNGSGKSNFLSAIEFVLGSDYARLGEKGREELLYSGGRSAASASVEVILDNTNHEIIIEGSSDNIDIIRIKRRIDALHDQYTINGKVIARKDLMKLLKSAGYSMKYSEYNIVQQGKITELVTACDNDRLKLLHDISGLTDYEEMREEALKVVASMRALLPKFLQDKDEVMQHRDTLMEDMESMKQYERHMKNKEQVQYFIYKKVIEKKRLNLEALERELNIIESNALPNLYELKGNVTTCLTKVENCERDIKEVGILRDNLRKDMEIWAQKKNELARQITQLNDKTSEDGRENDQTMLAIDELKKKIEQTRSKQETLRDKYEEAKKNKDNGQMVLTKVEEKRRALLKKQQRSSEFSNQNERDRWIDGKISRLNVQFENENQNRQQIIELLEESKSKIEENNRNIAESTSKSELLMSAIVDKQQTCSDLTRSENEQKHKLTELQLEKSKLQNHSHKLEQDLAQLQTTLSSCANHHIRLGCSSIQKVLEIMRESGNSRDIEAVKGYHGLVLNNVRCSEELHTAVEVCAGNQMYYHIVETDDISSYFLDVIHRQKLPGRVIFIPLDRINPEIPEYIEQDETPLISLLSYDRKFEPVMKFIFGRTLLCDDLEEVASSSSNNCWNYVTYNGERLHANGLLLLGYGNRKTKGIMALEEQKRQLNADIRENVDKIVDLEVEIQRFTKDGQQIRAKIAETEKEIKNKKQALSQLKGGIQLLKNNLRANQKSFDSQQEFKIKCDLNIESIRIQLETLRKEKEESFLCELSEHDMNLLRESNSEIDMLEKQQQKALAAFSKLHGEYTTTECRLHNLLKDLSTAEELINRTASQAFAGNCKLTTCIDDVAVIDEKIRTATNTLDSVQSRLQDLSATLIQYRNSLQASIEAEQQANDTCIAHNANLGAIICKQRQETEALEDTEEKLNAMGVSHREVAQGFAEMNLKQLYREMDRINGELNRFASINKDALIQLKELRSYFTKVEKAPNFNALLENFQELRLNLDSQIFNVFQETYTQVASHFSDVFERMVPGGMAKLVIRRLDETAEMQPEDTIDTYSGIGIRASFTPKDDEQNLEDMLRLSGGEKTIVALAFIFAMHSHRPSPFYLFDEIDRALDPTFRQRLSEILLAELSHNTQFIIITFRPELIQAARQCFYIEHRENGSHIDSVTKEFAISFVGSNDI